MQLDRHLDNLYMLKKFLKIIDLPYLFIQGTFNVPFYSTTKLETIDCSEEVNFHMKN